MVTERRLTTSRMGRLSMLGKLTTGIAGSVLGEGARQIARGQAPKVSDLLLTPTNARRLSDQLSEMRGAAMKVGQLLSMDSGHLLPPQFVQLLARLRDDAHAMPLLQVAEVLKDAWGHDWQNSFQSFSFTPMAAASIGQVHLARLKDGSHLAVKIQYPGIKDSIDSDVDNVASLLGLFRVPPRKMDLSALLSEAKIQLHAEANYLSEAESIRRYTKLLCADSRFETPRVIDHLTTERVLTMSLMDGQPIETLSTSESGLRNQVGSALLELALKEVFDWGLVQTDPNFANYLHDPSTGRIQLLDFGATRSYSAIRRENLKYLLSTMVSGDRRKILSGAMKIGYVEKGDAQGYQDGIIALLKTVAHPLTQKDPFNFADPWLADRMRDIVLELRVNNGFGRVPPPDILFLHRKLGGLYLLLAHLRARLPVAPLIKPYLN